MCASSRAAGHDSRVEHKDPSNRNHLAKQRCTMRLSSPCHRRPEVLSAEAVLADAVCFKPSSSGHPAHAQPLLPPHRPHSTAVPANHQSPANTHTHAVGSHRKAQRMASAQGRGRRCVFELRAHPKAFGRPLTGAAREKSGHGCPDEIGHFCLTHSLDDAQQKRARAG